MCSKEVAGTTGLVRFYSVDERGPAKHAKRISARSEDATQLRTFIVDAATPIFRQIEAVIANGDVIAPTPIIMKGFCNRYGLEVESVVINPLLRVLLPTLDPKRFINPFTIAV